MYKQIRWLRVVVAALFVEIGLIVAAVPLIPLLGEALVFRAVVPLACLVVPFVVAFLATRPLPTGRALHGVLIGAVATAMYFALVIGTSSLAEAAAAYGWHLFVAVNVLRLGAAAAGGYAAQRRSTASA